MDIGNDIREAFGSNSRVVDSQTAIPIIQTYINASNELVARRALNANKTIRNALIIFYGTALKGLDVPSRIATRRYDLLRQSVAIGATNAFFAAAQHRKLPYPLLQYRNESNNDELRISRPTSSHSFGLMSPLPTRAACNRLSTAGNKCWPRRPLNSPRLICKLQFVTNSRILETVILE